ncbi:hypothetical protein C8Q74DRAFT_1341797 [Fomes fomentarius]|nr:hypothetical protein C8Q74DRAFT_1341797 [Fomes fomentarius]
MGTFTDTDVFVRSFLPIPNSNTSSKPPVMPQRIIDLIINANSEREIAEAWSAWLNPTTKNAKGPCPGYRLGLSQDRWEKRDPSELKVDGALYQRAEFANDGRPHWERVRALLEFTRTADDRLNPYDNKSKGDESSDTRTDVRGQITSYVAHAFSHQHRTSLLLFLVTGTKMRVARWDRSRTLFTKSFDYTEPRGRYLLRDILFGFSFLERDKQGLDDTATPLTKDDEDYKKMDRVAAICDTDISAAEGTVVDDELELPYTFDFVRAAFRESLAHDATRYRLTVPAQDSPDQKFLVGKPLFVAPGMSGRGMRGFVAWDTSGGRFVFLKDAWRPHYENVNTEGKVLRALRDAGVKNTPTHVCDGELEQFTVTREHSANSSSSKPTRSSGTKRMTRSVSAANKSSVHRESAGSKKVLLSPQISPSEFVNQGKTINGKRHFRHYRLVVEEVCLPLCDFTNGKQLMTIVRDCVEAHAEAYKKAKIIHRDVSAGNILICPTVIRDEKDGKLRVVWRGILSDWELSKSLVPEGDQEQARQPVRTHQGTWQFRSAYILDNPEEPVTIADEIEAFHHVSLYNSLRYLSHTCTDSEGLHLTMFHFFDDYSIRDGSFRCGSHKRDTMRMGGVLQSAAGHPIEFFYETGNYDSYHPINLVFRTMLKWFKARYIKIRPRSVLKVTQEKWAIKVAEEMQLMQAEGSNVVDKLDDHDALLSLLNESLEQDWPVNDKVGDQLATGSAYVQSMPASDFYAGASDDEEATYVDGGDADEAPGAGDSDKRSAKRAKTGEKRNEAPVDDDPGYARPKRALATRTRGQRIRRGTSWRAARSAYNLRRTETA